LEAINANEELFYQHTAYVTLLSLPLQFIGKGRPLQSGNSSTADIPHQHVLAAPTGLIFPAQASRVIASVVSALDVAHALGREHIRFIAWHVHRNECIAGESVEIIMQYLT